MLKIKTSKRGGAKHTARILREAASAAAVGVVGQWHDQYMPGHFDLAAARKYDYQPRKGDGEPAKIEVTRTSQSGQTYRAIRANPHYSWRKRRQKGHNCPLVWSGDSERAARQQVALSSRFSKAEQAVKATAAMPGLQKYFYQYRSDLGQPDKAAELLRTTSDEVAGLGRHYRAEFDGRLAAANAVTPPATTL